ncbi:MAG: NAD(P)H:quinone oxidoreductase [Alicyclobacillus macrosporangiidus]|uniref:NAD(P)H:quinone oxidoreductase n=1 Tax=Alicyclobacillus macrosporangiidus TaxID=392015 RepID=UPI0026EBE2D3|nr:NAD(P)H:quinone oxidoreductase [Alicyclobacillus macrosporangiidus]MCL6597805.1 NAD(P)H:quinone oxidoreductase [Alicyclobacillus macrosporangiidus]
MAGVKLAILYYSSTGTNYKMAQVAAEAAKQAGAEVKVLKVPELAPEEAIAQNPAWKAHYEATRDVPTASAMDIEWADALLFSVPTRFGNVPSQMKQFIDTLGGLWAQGKTVNKVVSAMASAQNPHGGQEATILSLYTTMYHWGAIVVAPGYTDASLFAAGGNPYGTSVTVVEGGQIDDKAIAAIQHQTRRLITVAQWLKAGQAQG